MGKQYSGHHSLSLFLSNASRGFIGKDKLQRREDYISRNVPRGPFGTVSAACFAKNAKEYLSIQTNNDLLAMFLIYPYQPDGGA
jgi:hypothetical protein